MVNEVKPARLIDFFIPAGGHIHLRVSKLIQKPDKLHLVSISLKLTRFASDLGDY